MRALLEGAMAGTGIALIGLTAAWLYYTVVDAIWPPEDE